MARVSELIWKSNNRSVIRGLEEIAAQSEKTDKQITRDSNRASASFDRVGTHAKRLRETVGGLAGAIGFGGLAFGLADAVKGGIQLQGAQAQLRASLHGSKSAVDQLSASAERLSTHGGFGLPQNLQALTAFVRETHSASKAQQGLALATDIARGRNIDLGSAQMVVQRAYGGSIGRLQALLGPMVAVKNAQFGLTQAHKQEVLQLEAQAKAMGKAGPLWLQQQEALRGITPQMQALAVLQDKSATGSDVIAAAEKVFGGATGAFAGTTQGKVSNLQHSLQNLTDTTGEKLLPAVNMLAKDATVVVNLFGKLPVPLQAAVLGFTVLGVLLAPLKNSVGLLKGAFDLFRGSVAETTPQVARLGGASEVAATEEVGGGGVGGLGGAGKVEKKASRLGRGLKLIGFATGVGAVVYTGAEVLNTYGTPDKKASRITSPITGHQFYNPRVAPFTHAQGGVVGGPMGTDTVPGWLTPGEGVVSLRGMAGLGPGGLAALNSGHSAGPQNITLNVQLRMPNGRVLAEEVIKYSLNRAARGPTSLIGGSLVTGSAGLPV